MPNKSIIILISGNGSNLQAFIEAQKAADFGGEIVAVISNKADAFGLSRAESAGIPALSVQHSDYPSRESFDQALADEINRFKPDLIILAGFMRILTAGFVAEFRGRLLNIHPSLLPKYPGLHTHKRALENNDEYHGTTVHFVTEELDGGPLVAQAKTRLSTDDTEEQLLSRIQTLEHQLYPSTVKMLLKGQIELKQDDVYFENNKLEQAITF
jgi:phosphoribosylglycinamide formyltransferase-1